MTWAHTDIHANIRHAECATWFSNGMPRLCVRPHSLLLWCSPWLSSQFTATCSLSFFAIWSPTDRTHWHVCRVPKAARSSLWLTGCISSSLTPPLLWHSLSVHCLTRVVRCVSAPPLALLSNFDLWWFDELQRDSGRVYGTAESGISSASFKVLHLTSVPVIFATSFPLSIFHVFPLLFSVFRSFLFCTKKIPLFPQTCRFDFVFEKRSRLWVKTHVDSIKVFFPIHEMLTDVSLSPSCHLPLELSVESKFG